MHWWITSGAETGEGGKDPAHWLSEEGEEASGPDGSGMGLLSHMVVLFHHKFFKEYPYCSP